MLATVRRLQAEYLIDLEDAVVVTKDSAGKVKLHQSHDLTAEAALGGAVWGTLIGLLFMVPFAGTVLGAGIGALTGSLSDYGIDDGFARELGADEAGEFRDLRAGAPDDCGQGASRAQSIRRHVLADLAAR